MVITKSTA